MLNMLKCIFCFLGIWNFRNVLIYSLNHKDISYFCHDLIYQLHLTNRGLFSLKGPALLVHNNAEFTEEDWKGIKMLYSSIKEFDKTKVGRFGLGFKSVFHITGTFSSNEFFQHAFPCSVIKMSHFFEIFFWISHTLFFIIFWPMFTCTK